MNHSIQRHRRLYFLFRQTGTHPYRHELVWSFSHGRTDDSSQLHEDEITLLINHLERRLDQSKQTYSGIDPNGQQMRRRILSLCYTLGWTRWDEARGKHVVDFSRLHLWMKKYGYLHKGLNDYSYQELPRLVTQFENMTCKFLRPLKAN